MTDTTQGVRPAKWGEWKIARETEGDYGVAAEFHHPSGEVILASTFEPVERVDTENMNVMFYRENIGTFSDATSDEQYDPIMVAITGFEATKDFAKRHDKQMGWIDGMWAEEGIKNSDINQQDLLDEYFTD